MGARKVRWAGSERSKASRPPARRWRVMAAVGPRPVSRSLPWTAADSCLASARVRGRLCPACRLGGSVMSAGMAASWSLWWWRAKPTWRSVWSRRSKKSSVGSPPVCSVAAAAGARAASSFRPAAATAGSGSAVGVSLSSSAGVVPRAAASRVRRPRVSWEWPVPASRRRMVKAVVPRCRARPRSVQPAASRRDRRAWESSRIVTRTGGLAGRGDVPIPGSVPAWVGGLAGRRGRPVWRRDQRGRRGPSGR